MRNLRKAGRVVERARDWVRRSLAKAMFAVGGNELWSHLGRRSQAKETVLGSLPNFCCPEKEVRCE